MHTKPGFISEGEAATATRGEAATSNIWMGKHSALKDATAVPATLPPPLALPTSYPSSPPAEDDTKLYLLKTPALSRKQTGKEPSTAHQLR